MRRVGGRSGRLVFIMGISVKTVAVFSVCRDRRTRKESCPRRIRVGKEKHMGGICAALRAVCRGVLDE